MVWNWR